MLALIVDDDHAHQRIHKIWLNHFEVECVVVENGKEAVDLFDAETKFDLIIMDMQMPVMDGIQATMTLRAKGYKGMIAGFTSCNEEADKDAFIAAGANNVYAKPMNIEKASAVLNEYLNMFL